MGHLRSFGFLCCNTFLQEPMANSFFSNFTIKIRLPIPWWLPKSFIASPFLAAIRLTVTPVSSPGLRTFYTLLSARIAFISLSRCLFCLSIRHRDRDYRWDSIHTLSCVDWERHLCALGLGIGCTTVPAGLRRHGMAVTEHGKAVADTLCCHEHQQALRMKG